MSPRPSALRSTLILSISRVVAAALTLMTGVFSAALFGASPEKDCFVIAQTIPNLLSALLMGGLYASLVIAVVEVGEREGKAGQILFTRRILAHLGLLLAPAAALLILFPARFVRIVGPGFTAESIPLSANLMRIAILTVVCWVAYAGFRALLESRGLYMLSAVVYLAIGTVTFIFLISSARYLGIYALGIGSLLGTAIAVVLQFAVGVPRLSADRDEGIKAPPDRGWHRELERRLWFSFVPMSVAASVTQVNLLVDNAFGSLLPVGRVTLLGFAYVILANADLIIMTAIAEVALPRLSAAARQGDESLGRLLNRQLRVMFLITAPLCFGMLSFGPPVVRTVFERGRFGPGDTLDVAGLLVCYAPAILFMGVLALLLRTLAARHRPRIVIVTSLLAIIANGLFDALLYPPFGINGIASATTMVTIVSTIVMLAAVRREVGTLFGAGDASYGLRVMAAAGLMGAVLAGWRHFYEGHFGTATTPERLLEVAGGGVLAASVYALALHLLRVAEAQALMGRIVRKS
jgi:putative peptidoglycan lipid II flippase